MIAPGLLSLILPLTLQPLTLQALTLLPPLGIWLHLLVALAGGLGAGTRFAVDGWLSTLGPRRLPVSTLIINTVGSFLLGALLAWAPRAGADALAMVLGVGFLGGFTTFSTASVELVRLVRADRPRDAVVLAVAMLAFGVGGALLGALLGGRVPTA